MATRLRAPSPTASSVCGSRAADRSQKCSTPETIAVRVGQSFATQGRVRNGKVDRYPWAGKYTTSAQAEGAIEGTARQYEVASAYATAFAFSRFGLAGSTESPSPNADATAFFDASSIERIPVHFRVRKSVFDLRYDAVVDRRLASQITEDALAHAAPAANAAPLVLD